MVKNNIEFSAESLELMKGAIEIHVHPGPSLFPRSVNDRELAEQARNRGMRAVVLKAHEESTVSRAKIANDGVEGISIFGSIVLNMYVGGLNPYAADIAIRQGAKIVWMPTVSAKQHIEFFGGTEYKLQKSSVELLPQEGISIFDEQGLMKDSVYEIVDVVAKSGVILGSGHLSPQETYALADLALQRGVEHFLVTHPDFTPNQIPVSQQIELARKGAFIEKSMLTLVPGWATTTRSALAESIRQIGVDQCVLQTDFGQAVNPSPVQGMQNFLDILLQEGFSADEIRQMSSITPARLLRLD
jgi:Family of unknown function (DUF6282)